MDEAPKSSRDLFSEAAQLGISKRTLERAKAELNIKATPLRLPQDLTKNVWFWHYQSQAVSIDEEGNIKTTPLTKNDGGHGGHGRSTVSHAKNQHRQEKPLADMDGGVENTVQDGETSISANSAMPFEGGGISQDDAADWDVLVGTTEGEL